MLSIQGRSNFVIQNDQFTIVRGPQHDITHTHNNRVVVRRKEKKKQSIWDEYKRVQTEDVYIKRVVESGRVEDELVDVDHHRWRRVDVRRTFSIARIRGEGDKAEFLHVEYNGPEAFKAFRRDFAQFSAMKHPNVAQLYGYNDQRSSPALIFYDALIPLNHVLLVGNRLPLVLDIYFCFLFGVSEMGEGVNQLSSTELWIEPRSGMLRRGPPVQNDRTLLLSRLSNTPRTSLLDPLPIQAYSDADIVFDYLLRILPIETILEQVGCKHKISWDQLTAVEAFPYIAGSLSRSHHITRYQWTGLMEMPRYVCVECWPPAIDKHKIVMEDGSMRFRFTDSAAFKAPWRLQYNLFFSSGNPLHIRKWWLAQAHSVFNQLGIHEEEWKEYSILGSFFLVFYPAKDNAYQQGMTDTALGSSPVYLFIRPVPCPSDDETVWQSWAESAKYFWSFDSSGQEEMLESTRISLGIPSFTAGIEVHRYSWNLEDYKAIEKLHISKGFDPETTDLAHSFGYPFMRIIGDKDRFEYLDSTSSATIADILGSYDDLNVDDNGSVSGIPYPDDEIIVYLRQGR
ncbi:hypothetical protein Moror_9369 [Moniliophthora roreri MCA 2997]|uniref:Protein kinase domain-containing protein n=1 Tax=Moniliophthora roreri (strain MCA 2997) TaxID=1381753 RepID=V2WZV9_MONRO|nr:hypothetical protein Moror_9369 [Moniliophthora roreri MCA 2997]